MIVPYRIPAERAEAQDQVARHLAGDGIVAYPTETVYGLGCALRAAALEKLAAFKGPRPFLVLIRSPDEAPGLAWTVEARALAEYFWPGALTLALDAEHGRWPAQVVGPDGAVAVRISAHPAVADVIAAAGGPVTSTSANLPGDVPACDADSARVAAAALARDLLVLDGGVLPPAVPSTIVRCGARVRILREGAIARADLEAVVELE